MSPRRCTADARVAASALALFLSLSASSAAPPLFGQYRFDGGHGGNAAAVAGPGAALSALQAEGADGSPAWAGGLFVQPVVAGDGTAIFVTALGDVVATQPGGGSAPLWTYASGFAASSNSVPAISPDGSRVVVLLGLNVIALDAATGALVWSNALANTFTQPPVISADGVGVTCATASTVYTSNLTDGSPLAQYSGVNSVGPIAADVDAGYGNCIVAVTLVSTLSVLRKYCEGYPDPSSPVWSYSLGNTAESATLPPIVAGGVVYVVTAQSGYLYAVDSATGAQVCASPTPITVAISQPPVFVGGLYGLAFVLPLVGVVAVTGPGATACNPVAVVELGGAGTFTPIVVDSDSIGYFVFTPSTTGLPVLHAIDYAVAAPPPLRWNITLPLASSSTLSAPALGKERSILFTWPSPLDSATLQLLAVYAPVPPSVCAPGEISLRNGTCAACPVGSYSGPVNATAPATRCALCPAGSSSPFNSSLASSCAPCPAGFFSSGAGGPCVACAAGAYAAAANTTNCSLCPAGTASATLNATSSAFCVGCSAGSAAPAPGASTCSACVAGTFAEAANATACSAASPRCYTKAGSALACGAAMPYAQFGVDFLHSGQSALAGPGAAPSVVQLPIFSGQPSSLPLSGLALGPSGGVVAGLPHDGLVFMGLTDDIFAVRAATLPR